LGFGFCLEVRVFDVDYIDNFTIHPIYSQRPPKYTTGRTLLVANEGRFEKLSYLFATSFFLKKG